MLSYVGFLTGLSMILEGVFFSKFDDNQEIFAIEYNRLCIYNSANPLVACILNDESIEDEWKGRFLSDVANIIIDGIWEDLKHMLKKQNFDNDKEMHYPLGIYKYLSDRKKTDSFTYSSYHSYKYVSELIIHFEA